MIRGPAFYISRVHELGAGVTHMGNGDFVVAEKRCQQGGVHAVLVLSGLKDTSGGSIEHGTNQASQRRFRRRCFELGKRSFNRQTAGDVTVSFPATAVRAE